MSAVFISFRNSDEPYAAALLYWALTREFGSGTVFRSSDSIPPGSPWAKEIWEHHHDCAVLLAVIGPRWLTAADSAGALRLHQPDDWVRLEIARALADGKVVIPVLVGRTDRLSATSGLPADLAVLPDLQAFRVDHRRADQSIAELAQWLRELGITSAHHGVRTPQARGTSLWNVPRLSPFAVLRKELLDTLHTTVLQAGGTGPVVVHGQLGTGKSQLVTEYAHQFADAYQAAWWVSAEPPELMPAQFASLAAAAGFDAGSDARAALPALSARLSAGGRWLLIVDGVAEPAVVAPYLAALANGADTLITSRDSGWGLLAAAQVRVGPFRRDESVELLGTLIGNADQGELGPLAGELDDLPLAVAQAAVFLAGASMPPGDYITLLSSRSRELLARGDTGLYPGSLAAAWALGQERLAHAQPQAVQLLELGSVFAASTIPFSLLRDTAERAGLATLGQALGDPLRQADLARAVVSSGLAEVTAIAGAADGGRGTGLALRALLQSFIRQGLDEQALTGLREGARGAIASQHRGDPRAPGAPGWYDPLLPHVVALDLAVSADPACRRCLLDVVHYLIVHADAGTALVLAEDALNRWQAAGRPGDPMVLAAMARVAQARYWLGDYARAAAMDEAVLGSYPERGDPAALTAAHNLGIDLWAEGTDREQARRMLADVADQRRRALGPGSPDTLRSVHNLALSLRADGRYTEALALDRDVYRGLVAALGPDHPDTLRSAYAMALDLRALGKAAEALELEEDTFQRRRHILGADHPDTLRSAYGVAVGLRLAGELPRARIVAHDAYERRTRILGAGHADTLRSMYLLGLLLTETGDPEAGGSLREEAGVLLGLILAR
jgi:TIR domain/Tetratricopeptide repeat